MYRTNTAARKRNPLDLPKTGTGLLCIFNLPVVSMEGQVNDHLVVVAQYPLSRQPTTLRQTDQKLFHLGGDFLKVRLATYLLQLNISKVIALLILRKHDEEDFCLCCSYYSGTEIKGLLQDKGILVRGFFIFKTN